MAKGSNTWIWWTIGGLAVVGLGVGIFIFIKDRKAKKQQEKMGDAPITSSSPSYSPSSQTSSSPTLPPTPFKNANEGNEFRAWVHQYYKDVAKEFDLDLTGKKWDNANMRKAYAKLKGEWDKRTQSSAQTATTTATSSNSTSVLNTLKTAIQGGYVKDVKIDGDRVRGFALDGTGFGSNNIYVNLYPNGYIYYEDGRDSNKKAGSWSGTSPMTIKIEGQEKVGDPKYTITDLAKILYPDVKGGFAFSEQNDFDDFIHNGKSDFVDGNDSLL